MASTDRAFPWDGAVPAHDLAAFVRAPAPINEAPLAGQRPALLIVDMTRMFVDEGYPSGCGASARRALKANTKLLGQARACSVPVFFTKGYADPKHSPSTAERGLWKHGSLEVPGLPPGDVIAEPLTPRSEETIICKGSKPSAFFGTGLISMLVALSVDTVIVTGISTSGCVRATALDAFQYNLRVLIPYQATADRSEISHKISLFDLHMKYANVVELDTVLNYLSATREAAT